MGNPWSQRRIPLAWLLLTRQPARLAVALAGIAFAGILMFMQLGFRDGLFDASVVIHKRFDADLVLISPRTTSSVGMAPFPRRRLVQAMADPQVIGITPVHWNLLLWRNPKTRLTRSILALGFEPGDPLFTDPGLMEKAKLLTQQGLEQVALEEQGAQPEGHAHRPVQHARLPLDEGLAVEPHGQATQHRHQGEADPEHGVHLATA